MTLSALDRVRLRKAAQDEGFGLDRGESDEWMAFDSLHAPASLRLTHGPAGYIAAINHRGVAADLATRWQVWGSAAPTGFTAFAVPDSAPLHYLVREMWRLAQALPVEPLREFEARTRDMPRTTEAERLVVQRLGQDIFRDALIKYWGGACGPACAGTASSQGKPHQALEGLRDRCRAPRRVQRPATCGPSRCRFRRLPHFLRRRRPHPHLAGPDRARPCRTWDSRRPAAHQDRSRTFATARLASGPTCFSASLRPLSHFLASTQPPRLGSRPDELRRWRRPLVATA
jgi:hypothetical protein